MTSDEKLLKATFALLGIPEVDVTQTEKELLSQVIQKEVRRLCDEVIGADEDERVDGIDNPHDVTMEDTRNGLRAEQRARLSALVGRGKDGS